jgi:hypothetical protein
MAHREKWTTQSAPHTYRLGESQNEASRLTQTCVQRTGCGTVWEYLRGNKLSNTIYENYDDILEKACQAWMFFANDKERVASITTRQWAKVNL